MGYMKDLTSKTHVLDSIRRYAAEFKMRLVREVIKEEQDIKKIDEIASCIERLNDAMDNYKKAVALYVNSSNQEFKLMPHEHITEEMNKFIDHTMMELDDIKELHSWCSKNQISIEKSDIDRVFNKNSESFKKEEIKKKKKRIKQREMTTNISHQVSPNHNKLNEIIGFKPTYVNHQSVK